MFFEYNAEEFLLRLIFVIIHSVYMITGNYLAQKITDHNNDVFTTV